VALALGVGAASFALVAVAVVAADSGVLVALIAVVCVAAAVAIARLWGVVYAAPMAIAALLAFDWFQFPPTHPHRFPASADLANLLAYLAVAVLIGELAAYAGRRADVSEVARSELAEEQAALRRVATLVARDVSPDEVFAAVAEELGVLLGVDATHMGRYWPDGTATGVANWSTHGDHVPVGTRMTLEGDTVTAAVQRSGRPARIEGYDEAPGAGAAVGRAMGLRSSVGAPIVVDGELWGVMIASSKADEPLPADTEARIADFTELVATAISNTEARAKTARLAEEQAALRRVATLVAQAVPAGELFRAVTEELGALLGADLAAMTRYEDDHALTVVATWAATGEHPEVGLRLPLEDGDLATAVLRTGRPVRMAGHDGVPTRVAVLREMLGIRSSVASPIVVEGRPWGGLIVHSRQSEPLPADTEWRIQQFTELAATAISNIQARSDLAASRARVVAAADAERRRLVRDLHDGAQQRLVHTVITLKLAHGALEREDVAAAAMVAEALGHAEAAMRELRELVHGILPAVLTGGGLRAVVDALAARMPVPVENAVSVGRLPAAVEATAYFVVAEALTNVAKHAHARRAAVSAVLENGTLAVQVRDDGVGGARSGGSGLLGLGDRLAVVDGRLRVESPAGGGTLVAAAIPLER
jgi:signal transduction histidine kinase